MCDSRQPIAGVDSPVDIQERVQAEMATLVDHHKPEGISVMVKSNIEQLLHAAALLIAAQEYPGIELTGRVLYTGLNELGDGLHEVVLEVK